MPDNGQAISWPSSTMSPRAADVVEVVVAVDVIVVVVHGTFPDLVYVLTLPTLTRRDGWCSQRSASHPHWPAINSTELQCHLS